MLYSEKIEQVTQLSDRFQRAPITILADYRGLTVSAITELRSKLRAADGELLVAKNTLTKLAIRDTPNEAATEWLAGPTALAFGFGDPVALAKVVKDFAKDNEKLELKGGVMEGQRLDASEVERLASMPSKDEMRAQFLALLMTPATQLVRILSAPAQEMAQVLGARQRQLEESDS
ncbi:MAG: large subunit ribosomal protein L10 [Hyphomicrobiaceae bacterium]|jgi:large subunit ribosomal protein L10